MCKRVWVALPVPEGVSKGTALAISWPHRRFWLPCGRQSVPPRTRDWVGELLGNQGCLSQARGAECHWSAGGLTRTTRHSAGAALALVESIPDPLRHVAQREHTRHWSPANFRGNLLSGWMAGGHPPPNTIAPTARLPARDLVLSMTHVAKPACSGFAGLHWTPSAAVGRSGIGNVPADASAARQSRCVAFVPCTPSLQSEAGQPQNRVKLL